MAETTAISDLQALRRWRTAARRASLPSLVPSIELALPHFSPEENRRLTLEITRLRQACGCGASGLAMTIAVLLVTTALATDGRPLMATPPVVWGAGLLFVALGAALGKLAGLLWARWQMVGLARAIEQRTDEGISQPA